MKSISLGCVFFQSLYFFGVISRFRKMEFPLQKFNGHNFHTWKVKIQLHLTSKNLWGIVKGIESEPTQPPIVVELKNRYNHAKSIIGLALSDLELHHIDLDKSYEKIWEELQKLFGAKLVNAKFYVKLQFFSFKMVQTQQCLVI